MSENIAILTSGGDAAGMNPAVKSAADYARKKGMVPYLVEWGLRGLIEGWIKEATPERLSGMLYRGALHLDPLDRSDFLNTNLGSRLLIICRRLRSQNSSSLVVMVPSTR